jgi:predicted MFS family arabinose efflux permease
MLAAGAAIGGAVTATFGRDLSFIVDAISFLVSAGVLWLMRARFAEERKRAEHPPLLESMRETARYAKQNKRVLALLSVKGGYGTGAGVVAMLSVFGKEVFKAGAWGIGLLFAARGLGALLGPFLIRGLVKKDEAQYRAITFAVLMFGAGYFALGTSKTLAVGLGAILFAHLGGGAAWQISSYGLQREAPDWIRGRIFSADYGFLTLTMALSSLAAGVLSDRIGPVIATCGIASLTIAWAAVWGVWTWRLWR